jgi:hypothetical protein
VCVAPANSRTGVDRHLLDSRRHCVQLFAQAFEGGLPEDVARGKELENVYAVLPVSFPTMAQSRCAFLARWTLRFLVVIATFSATSGFRLPGSDPR